LEPHCKCSLFGKNGSIFLAHYVVVFCAIQTPTTGSCLKKVNAVDAVQAYEAAITLLTDAGRLTQAAKLCKECAELFENSADEMAGSTTDSSSTAATTTTANMAIQFYEQAAELYDMEDSKSSANACRAKVAELASAALDPPDLLKASRLYNTLGLSCLDSNLLKFNAKGYFLQAILCQLANGGDVVGAEQALQRYEGVDYTFAESREGKFARQLVDCVERLDAESLATACFEYDRISKLDPWKTSMLVKVKRSIQENDGTGTGGGGGGGGGDEDDDVDLT
jgi:alpha-soluble NSF attachment protein